MNLLFWLSLVPFTTGWMGENHFAPMPTLVYGVNLFLAGVSYYILEQVIISYQGADSPLKVAIGRDWKGLASQIIYAVAIVTAIWTPKISLALYSLVALIWIVPDPRIERMYHL